MSLEYTPINELLGKTFTEVTGCEGGDELIFTAADGSRTIFYHSQDCCESVTIEEIIGDLSDLVGSPITEAEEATSDAKPEGWGGYLDDANEWTFYKFGTAKGFVTVRWYGASNGYYSTSVDMRHIPAAVAHG